MCRIKLFALPVPDTEEQLLHTIGKMFPLVEKSQIPKCLQIMSKLLKNMHRGSDSSLCIGLRQSLQCECVRNGQH